MIKIRLKIYSYYVAAASYYAAQHTANAEACWGAFNTAFLITDIATAPLRSDSNHAVPFTATYG